MVKHIEHHWGIYLAGAWYLGPPCLCTYLMGSGWLVPSFMFNDSMLSFFQALKLCPTLLPMSLGSISKWLIDIWSYCGATTTSDQSQLKHSCWVHTRLLEILNSLVGFLHPHGPVTFWFTLFMCNMNVFKIEIMYDYYIAMKFMFLVVKLSSHSFINYASLTILLPRTTHKQHQNYSKPKAFKNPKLQFLQTLYS